MVSARHLNYTCKHTNYASIAAVFVDAEPIEQAAQEWLGRYQNDNTVAMTELVNFMLKAAGCDVKVTEDDINDFDNAAGRLRDVQDQYQSVSLPCEVALRRL